MIDRKNKNETCKNNVSFDPLLPPRVVAEWTGESVSTLARHRVNGDGPPFVKIGTKRQSVVRYRRSDVERWIESQIRRSTSDRGDASDQESSSAKPGS